MTFPTIAYLDDIPDGVLSDPNLKTMRADGMICLKYDYRHYDPDSEHADWYMEMRGIIFHADTMGIISRPVRKIWNLGEHGTKFDPQRSHRIELKIDGSMIRTVDMHDHHRLATKSGITDISALAERCMERNYPDERRWMDDYLAGHRHTLVFEYVGPHNTVVIGYPEEQLILLTVRDNVTGEYIYDLDGLDIPFPYLIGHDMTPDNVRQNGEHEGIVICHEDGHRIKVKSDWYVDLHHAIEHAGNDRNVIRLYCEEKLDDILCTVPDTHRQMAESILGEYRQAVTAKTDYLNEAIHRARRCVDRKQVALEVAAGLRWPLDRQVLFRNYGNPADLTETDVWNVISDNTTQGSFGKIRQWLGTDEE